MTSSENLLARPGWRRLGALLAERRRRRHIPIRDLARATGYRYVQVSEVENGLACPSDPVRFEQWLSVVGVTIDEAREALGSDAPFLYEANRSTTDL